MLAIILALLITSSRAATSPSPYYNPFIRGGTPFSNLRQEWCLSEQWLLERLGKLHLHSPVRPRYQPDDQPRAGGILFDRGHPGLAPERPRSNWLPLHQYGICLQHPFDLLRPHDHSHWGLSLHPFLPQIHLQISPNPEWGRMAGHASCLLKLKISKYS